MNVNQLQVGSVVECELAVFTVGKIYQNGFVEMDPNKPYKVKDEASPMAKYLGTGRLAVDVRCLRLAE